MQLSKELIEKFQAAIADKYEEIISYETAESALNELAELIRLTAAPEESK